MIGAGRTHCCSIIPRLCKPWQNQLCMGLVFDNARRLVDNTMFLKSEVQ